MQVGEDAPLQQKGQVGLNHLAWMMGSLDDLKAMYSRLKKMGVRIDNVMESRGRGDTASGRSAEGASAASTPSVPIGQCRDAG